ncbi:hypothetical protein F53441_7858 [Fusarium austroafricanum]|uniref:Uncharacterized protein n=1 Tax=Fusarium austroafricanum TaxID=2364996 RepID=A0A8H4KGP4_9HYPO|nr:hypothetical protein F53441_7858 [Fusarium austroafricanum]
MGSPSGPNNNSNNNQRPEIAVGGCLFTLGTKTKNKPVSIGAMVAGSVVVAFGNGGLESLRMNMEIIMRPMVLSLNMAYSNVEKMNPFES